jgi:hypothetical protein
MSAGLPGLGLGGLFFIFSALLAPFPELWRTLRGRSDRAAWREIGRQLAQALAMIAAIDLTLRLTYVVLSAAGIGNPPAADEAIALPLDLIGITTGLLVLVLCSAKLAELGLRATSGGLPPVPEGLPRVAPLRAAAFGAVAVIAWIALLVVGASELSPLERPHREQIAFQPKPDRRGPDRRAEPRQAAASPSGRAQGDRPSPSAATQAPAIVRNGGAETPGAAASPDGGGGAGAAPAPAAPAAEALPSKPPPTPAAPAGSEPNGPPAGGPATEAPPGGSGKPEPTGPPESAPASEGAGPTAEPPPQAPAKGLRAAE